jgi:hypothetical protein
MTHISSPITPPPQLLSFSRGKTLYPVHILVCALGLLWSVGRLDHPVAYAQSLSLETSPGEIGQVVEVTIHVNAAPTAVKSLGFDVLYDSTVLQYAGSFTRGNMVSGFTFFSANEPVPGRTRVAGFSVGDQIEVGHSGTLVTLQFQVLNPGQTTVSISRQVDDIAGWATQAGLFESITSQTPTEVTQDTASQASPEQPEQTNAEASQPSTTTAGLSTQPSTSRPSGSSAAPPPAGQPAARSVSPMSIVKPLTDAEKTTASGTAARRPASPPPAEVREVGTAQTRDVAQPSQNTQVTGYAAREDSSGARYGTQKGTTSDTSGPVRTEAPQPEGTAPHTAIRPPASGEQLAKVMAPTPVPARTAPVSDTLQPVGPLSQTVRVLLFAFVAVLLGVVLVVLASTARAK